MKLNRSRSSGRPRLPKRKLGRPRKHEEDSSTVRMRLCRARSKELVVRLTKDQWKYLETKAEAVDAMPADIAKLCLKAQGYLPPRTHIEPAPFRRSKTKGETP